MDQPSLLDLAKSLDIVETIYCEGGSVSADRTCATFANDQIYDFLIVIDFEATCWEVAEVKWKQPEIIGIFVVTFEMTLESLVKIRYLYCFRISCHPVEPENWKDIIRISSLFAAC